MSDLGLLLLPCCAGPFKVLVVLGELPKSITELFHLQLFPLVTSNLGQLQLLHRAGFLDIIVFLSCLGDLKFPQVLQCLLCLLQFHLLLLKHLFKLQLIPGAGASKFLDLG